MDRAGVFECELALASSVIFFGYVTTILPICSPKQIFVAEEFQLGDLSCFVKNGLRAGEGRGFPVSRRGDWDTSPWTGTEKTGTVRLQPKRPLHHLLTPLPLLGYLGIWASKLSLSWREDALTKPPGEGAVRILWVLFRAELPWLNPSLHL